MVEIFFKLGCSFGGIFLLMALLDGMVDGTSVHKYYGFVGVAMGALTLISFVLAVFGWIWT